MLLFTSIFCVDSAYAQTEVICSAPGITANFKRTIVQGSTVTVYFTLTNDTGRDMTPYLHAHENTRFKVSTVEAYDDEGDYYDFDSGNISVRIGSAQIQYLGKTGAPFSFPNEITIKGEITFKNVSEYSTSFTRIAIPFRDFDVTDGGYNRGYVIFKNVPITRGY